MLGPNSLCWQTVRKVSDTVLVCSNQLTMKTSLSHIWQSDVPESACK